MALTTGVLSRRLLYYLRATKNHLDYSHKVVHLQVDVLDKFTDKLMQQKAEKWDTKKSKLVAKDKPEIKVPDDSGDLVPRDVTQCHINSLFQEAIDNDNHPTISSLVQQCLALDKCPSEFILTPVLSTCSRLGDRETILQIIDLCRSHYPQSLVQNSNFEHFVAEATWVRGDVSKSIQLFDKVYRENSVMRRRIRLMLRNLIQKVVTDRSEAVLWTIIKFTEQLLADYNDYFPLTCVWQACFISEWYTDQCVALDLLERNKGLCNAVVSRIPFVVFLSLKCHRTEVVYRLLEFLLTYQMRAQYAEVLVSLLDYQFCCCDYKSCSEIITWAISNEVELPKRQHVKVINLLLNEKLDTPLAPLKSKDKRPTYELKF